MLIQTKNPKQTLNFTACKVVLSALICSLSASAFSAEWPHAEIRAVGKNLTTMAAFYVECSKQKYVEANSTAIRWASYMGGKYLIVGGIETEQQEWIMNGTQGILIEDPASSEKTMKIEFSKKACTYIKNHLDAQYELADRYISGSYKK